MLIRILFFVLLCNFVNAVGVFPGAKTPFSEAAMNEIKSGNPVAKATCFVKTASGDAGSGTFVELESNVFILTAAHLRLPKFVGFYLFERPSSTKNEPLKKTKPGLKKRKFALESKEKTKKKSDS